MFATGRWRYVAAGVLVVALAIVAAQAGIHLKKVWVVKVLKLPDGWEGGVANDVSDSGLIGGGFRNEGDRWAVPAFWKKGKPYEVIEAIGVPDGYEDAFGIVMSINNSQLAGATWNSPFDQVAMKWDVCKKTFLNLHPGDDYIASGAWGINARGDVCGFLIEPVVGGIARVPYVWRHCGKETELTRGDFAQGWTSGINSWGMVSGWAFDDFSEVHAVFWGWKGKMTDLHDEIEEALKDELNGGSLDQTIAYDVHENGMVVGQAYVAANYLTWPWSWTKKRGVKILDTGKVEGGVAWKAVGAGIAGSVGPLAEQDAAVWVKGRLDVIPDVKGYDFSEGSSLNRRGMVVGYAAEDELVDPAVPWVAWKKVVPKKKHFGKKKCGKKK